ncbi:MULTISPECIES: ABC transporter ATP-binding protein [Microbacterium]|uniref:ABC transporter ATP-binding protein n=1 Tax=Microbacterium TaxID=33882 RepID=UPI0010CA2DB2|nr:MULTISPECIES: ABC transporter ATP-binding protein [Microbacterium]QCQ15265.1 ABC transporter ATP-binding protein [Microbacterium sp. RG1]UIN30004.1 ABC transporter ATP-binding protein [Microbacterium binotii]
MSEPITAAQAAAQESLSRVAQTPGAPKPDPILVVDNIIRRFGGMTAVDVDHLEVQRGAITALIGPNGAGKTTFFNLITGFDKPTSAKRAFGGPPADKAARWSFDGRTLGSTAASKVARSGMVRTFQLTKALSRMTVLDNMLLGARDQPGENMAVALIPALWRKREKEITEKAMDLLQRFKLYEKREDLAGSLSGGQKKLLEMARALMSDPKMIMLDEPMAGVNPALTQSLLGHIQALRDDGTTVLFVEHDMHMVRHISDWVVVMAQGAIVAEGPAGEVMNQQAVVDAYLGAHHDTDLGDDSLLDTSVIQQLEAEAEAADAAAERQIDEALGKEHRS